MLRRKLFLPRRRPLTGAALPWEWIGGSVAVALLGLLVIYAWQEQYALTPDEVAGCYQIESVAPLVTESGTYQLMPLQLRLEGTPTDDRDGSFIRSYAVTVVSADSVWRRSFRSIAWSSHAPGQLMIQANHERFVGTGIRIDAIFRDGQFTGELLRYTDVHIVGKREPTEPVRGWQIACPEALPAPSAAA